MIGALVFGIILAGVVWLAKRLLKITTISIPVVIISVGMLIVLFYVWSMWFALWRLRLVDPVPAHEYELWGLILQPAYESVRVFLDFGTYMSSLRVVLFTQHRPIISGFMENLRYYVARGTWGFNDTWWSGWMLAATWLAEALVIAVLPIIAALSSSGLYLQELDAWVKPKFMNFGFSAFDDHELDKIASGDINVIINKPLEHLNGLMHAVAVCYHKGEPTDFIAIYQAQWDKHGVLDKNRHEMTIKLGAERIDALDTGLHAVHYPDLTEPAVPPPKKDEPPKEDEDIEEIEDIVDID